MLVKKEFTTLSKYIMQPDEMKIILIYRYISLLSISVFFLTGSTKITLLTKSFITASVALSAVLLSYLYQRNHESKGNIKLLIVMETIANSLFLIPTGGLGSPFVWYSINTILVSAVMLEGLYCWISLSSYLFASTCLTYLILDNVEQSFTVFINRESNLILCLILMTALIRQLVMYIKTLRSEGIKQAEMNRQLSLANGKVRESLSHIMELYQAVNMFTNLIDKEDMIRTIVSYTQKVTKADAVFFYSYTDEENRTTIKPDDRAKALSNSIDRLIDKYRCSFPDSCDPVEIEADGISYLLTLLRSNCIAYGVLGIEAGEPKQKGYSRDCMDQLQFMSDLGSIVFERLEAELANERLIIAEEQNRIANEIHDSVQQRLFSMSFGIYGISRDLENMTAARLKEELDAIRSSADNAMKELRTAIYSMSWSKNGADNFMVNTMKYIEEIKRLNNVNIDFRLVGSTDLLSLIQKKSIYRIICESVGNAIRHGDAGYIEIILSIRSSMVVLKIIDNGSGFDYELLKQNRRGGLGLKNLELLAQYLKGKMHISSRLGKGTVVRVTFPLLVQIGREENIV